MERAPPGSADKQRNVLKALNDGSEYRPAVPVYNRTISCVLLGNGSLRAFLFFETRNMVVQPDHRCEGASGLHPLGRC